jgi:hypothetical protein
MAPTLPRRADRARERRRRYAAGLRLTILFHDNCFDGAASAALFARFARARLGADETRLRGLHHVQGDPFPPGCFDGELNACVDFRYSADARLAWWFDHHASAFLDGAQRARFQAGGGAPTHYWDPAARSCCGFMARVLEAEHGFREPALDELVRWAEIVDGALFADARAASALDEPALQLAAWLEASRDPAARVRVVAALADRPIAEVAAEPGVAAAVEVIRARRAADRDRVARAARLDGDVVVVDLADDPTGPPGKFVAYELFPAARYAVGMASAGDRLKVSVGHNPWSTRARTHDIAKVCERWGGGGHAVVGGITLPLDVAAARAVLAQLVDVLKSG